MPDVRSASVYMRQADVDDWAGYYINLWFDGMAWMVRCVNPDGGDKIYLGKGDIMKLDCSKWDISDP